MQKNYKKIALVFTVLTLFALFTLNCRNTMQNKTESELSDFIKNHVAQISDKYKNAALAYFDASISGKEEDYKKSADLQFELEKIYSNKDDFAKIKSFVDSKEVKDTLLNRQLEMLFLAYQAKQVDENKLEAIIKLQNQIESKFTSFRAEINGKKLTDNEVETILTTSVKTNEVEQAWIASKKIGSLVSADVIQIVKMRNELAQQLGYKNYHEMSLKLNEQNPEEISALFDELDNLTRDAFAKEKEKIDEYLAAKFKIKKEELMPWHYQNRFFQEAPQIYPINIDEFYKDKDVVALSRNFYNSIGLPVDSILEKSDLYEKEGKYQHAFCTHIDRKGDVRVVCNIKPNSYWMNTQLHELGHAVYDKYLDYNTPFLLREPAHTFTTEAIAMIFGRFATNPQWLKEVVGISEEDKNKIAETCFNSLRLEQLVFSRWTQVMYRFEKSMYENPDQDLNKLWWDIVEKYQMMKRPANRNEADWASKIHIASYPCYYHNYLLGELFASQLYYYIVGNVLKSDDYKFQSFYNKPEVGGYLKDKVFAPGRKFYWNNMIEMATGEKLTAKYYAKQFVN